MTAAQLAVVREATPFQEFDLFLADGRVLHIAHPDLIAADADGRVAKAYCRPDIIEHLDLAQVVSLRIRSVGLFDDEAPEQ